MSDGEKACYLTDEYVVRLKQLSEAVASGEGAKVNDLIGELTTLRESSLFVELGKLTREIHDSINALSSDERVVELVREEIPDAKERLNYILTKTDNAAHKTMEEAESVLQEIDKLHEKSDSIRKSWSLFRTGELSKSDFLRMSEDMDKLFLNLNESSDIIRSRMGDIMLAQDYQDLTGQMIKQVITMVHEVEEKMVRLVAISGAPSKQKGHAHKDGNMAHGPQLPTADKRQVAANQDEVDDLLASHGF